MAAIVSGARVDAVEERSETIEFRIVPLFDRAIELRRKLEDLTRHQDQGLEDFEAIERKFVIELDVPVDIVVEFGDEKMRVALLVVRKFGRFVVADQKSRETLLTLDAREPENRYLRTNIVVRERGFDRLCGKAVTAECGHEPDDSVRVVIADKYSGCCRHYVPSLGTIPIHDNTLFINFVKASILQASEGILLYCSYMEKKLTRSVSNKMIAGVMGGLGEFFSIDPNLFRLTYVLLTVFTGFVPGIAGYISAIAIVPEGSAITPSTLEEKEGNDPEPI